MAGKSSKVLNGTNEDDILVSLEHYHINGNAGNDDITGTDQADKINGNEGDDIINGDAGDDEIHGNEGDDVITGGEGNDTIFGNEGNDTAVYAGSIFDHTWEAGKGNSTIVTDNNAVDGDNGVDTLKHIESLQFDDFILSLTGNNAAFVAADDQTTDEDTAVDFTVTATDFDGDVNTITSATAASGASVSVVSSTNSGNDTTFELNYNPGSLFQYLAVGESTVDQVTIELDDGNGGTTTKVIDVTVNGLNDAPVANYDAGITDEDSSVIVNLLGNDTDVDASDVLSIDSIDTAGIAGTVADNGDGTVTYNPNGAFDSLAAGETATETFSYTVSDGNGGTDTATVDVTINGVNDAPVANADSATTDEYSAVNIDLLANDTDVDASDVLSVDSIDTTGLLGTVIDNGDGTVTYNPNGAFAYLDEGETATETFSYTVSDGNGGTSTNTVTVDITGVNNQGFEYGNFNGWETIGNTNVESPGVFEPANPDLVVNPTEGAYLAEIISSNSTDNNNVENFLGLPNGGAGSIDSIVNGGATNGSAIKTSITVDAGDTVSFDWRFISDDYDPYFDQAFFTFDGNLTALDSVQPGEGSAGYHDHGWQTTSFVTTTAGTFEIGFGVVNEGDSGVDTHLYIDNLSIA